MEYSTDQYNSVYIKSENVPSDSKIFEDTLKSYIQEWEGLKVKGVWITLSKEKSHLIPVMFNNGFYYHNVLDDKLTMAKWLPKDRPNN